MSNIKKNENSREIRDTKPIRKIEKHQHNTRKPDNKIISFEVEKEYKLLDFLAEKLPSFGHKKLTSMLTHGQITVNGVVRTKYDTPIFKGGIVRVMRTGLAGKADSAFSKLINIIYEDEDIIVINKPAGLLTVSTDEEKTKTAYHLLTEYVRMGDPSARIYIVHRLDRDTSGIVVFAKNEEMKTMLQDRWDELCRYRGYLALTDGVPKDKEKRLIGYLKENSIHIVYMGSEGDGKKAITNFRVQKQNSRYALLEVWIETGRKNQIRVQLKDYGCPVIGDKRYGSASNPIQRLGLHAGRLEIENPKTGKVMRFDAKPNKKFLDFISYAPETEK